MKKPGFIAGMKYFLRGFSLINTTGVRRFVAIPLAINMILFIGALWLGIDYISDWVEQLQISMSADSEEGIQWLNKLIAFLSWILIPLFVLAFLAVMFYSFTLLANLIAAPFNSLLAEKIEDHLGGSSIPSTGNLFDMLKDVGGSFVSEGRKLLYFLVRTIPFILLFFLGFIFPPIGFIATLLWFFFSAWMLAIEYSDYPMGNHAMRFPDQRQTLKANRMFALGFGTATVAATMIPVVNFFAMPVAVAGSTAMWVDHWKDNIPQITVK
ncbi:MAG: sulfate transporter CysZ [Gammaproteobacteria bacterium]|nr:sulfate transporter CysZ [Gammaproteobacteria bacterium]